MMRARQKNDTGISMTHPASDSASAPAFHLRTGRSAVLALFLVAGTGLAGAATATATATATAPTGTAAAPAATLECPATVRLDAPKASASGLPAGTQILLAARPQRPVWYAKLQLPTICSD